jgi:branched-chain amino acid transport system substrate-binding protein
MRHRNLGGGKLLVALGATTVVAAVAVAVGVAQNARVGTAGAAATPIKIGVLSTCKGPFAVFWNETQAGARVSFISRGAKLARPGKSDSQLVGYSIGGHPIRLVNGCSDASPDVAVAEARRLVEREKVNILVGPLSGDEGIAVSRYAKKQPQVTFVNGTSAAQDTTLKSPSPNFFRFTTDGAQWMAGLGDYAYNQLKWRNVVTIADDYSFPYTQVAGFVAEFCALGGKVEKRIWPPLGTTDYSSYVAQIPSGGIDGFLLAVNGSGTVAFANAYEGLKGDLGKKMIGGGVAIDPTAIKALGDRLEGVVTAGPTAADSKAAAYKSYSSTFLKAFPKLKGLEASLFAEGYQVETDAVVRALTSTNGDLSNGQKAFRQALAKLSFTGPNGANKLDSNRNGIAPNYVSQVKGGTLHTIYTIPNVDQTFGGFFSPKTASPGRDSPECVKRTPPKWVGHAIKGPPTK